MIKTFRAKSIQQALAMVREQLGPDASVLHTRRVNTGIIGWLLRGSQVEVAATVEVACESAGQGIATALGPKQPIANEFDHRDRYREQLDATPGIDLGDRLAARTTPPQQPTEPPTHAQPSQPTALFDAFTTLIDAELDEPVCRELLDQIRESATGDRLRDPRLIDERLRQKIESQFSTTGPIAIQAGKRRVVALVGPTGVGKTTTLAKLAANFRLRQKLNVGLVTVDTYRVAAVEQLETYADIIDLPMEVVATPREMRQAMEKFAGFDLVLLDTAGRSPRDEVKLQELRSILAEAQPDEVQLALSTTASSRGLVTTAERFRQVGVTSLLLTKLDEAVVLGNLVTLARESRLPISYLTNGQNVPDDIATACPESLAKAILEPAIVDHPGRYVHFGEAA